MNNINTSNTVDCPYCEYSHLSPTYIVLDTSDRSYVVGQDYNNEVGECLFCKEHFHISGNYGRWETKPVLGNMAILLKQMKYEKMLTIED